MKFQNFFLGASARVFSRFIRSRGLATGSCRVVAFHILVSVPVRIFFGVCNGSDCLGSDSCESFFGLFKLVLKNRLRTLLGCGGGIIEIADGRTVMQI